MQIKRLVETKCTVQFRSLLRQSSQFSNYNFREYALRRTKDAFREHQHESEERKIQELIQEGLQSLRMMKVSLVFLTLKLSAFGAVTSGLGLSQRGGQC